MGRRVALLIATSRYVDSKLTALDSAVGEAHRLSQLFLDADLGGFDSAPVVIDGNKSTVERAVEDFLRACDADDEVLLYLTGHGIKNDHDQLFFAASDTDTRRPYSTAVHSTTIRSLLEECQARAKLVLLDCCYSGAFTKGPTHMSDEWTTVGQHLGQGTYVLAASNELQFAYVHERLVYDERPRLFSAFSDALIKGIETGGAARGGASTITADDLYAFVHDEVRAAGLDQTPTKSDKSEGQFVVARVRSNRIVVDGESPPPKLLDLLPADDRAAGHLVSPIGQALHNGGHGEPVLTIDLAGQEGHLAIVGRIYSGKSTLLHTLVSGLAHNRTPEQVTFYCLDSGAGFRGLRDLPHLKEVHAPSQHRAVERLLERLRQVVEARELMFRKLRIPRTAVYRELRGRGVLPGDHSDVFLVIDGWQQFQDAVPLIEDAVHQIADSGLHLGVHVVIAARNWAELPDKITPLLRGRIELQLDDPLESKISQELAGTLPEQPGWGLYAGRRFLTAITYQDNDDDYISDFIRRLNDDEPTDLEAEDDDPVPAAVVPTFLQMLDVPGSPEAFDVERAWRRTSQQDRYRVPLGTDDSGGLVFLDIKESSLGGVGPHGLLVGATGSGKSELMRTLVLGMVTTHSSADLNMILVDFKGGATYRGFDRAPHVAAIITNLAGDLALVDRMKDAIGGEVVRRQEVLAASGAKDRWDHEAARLAGANHSPLPALFLCIDEFSELLAAKPDFIDTFLQIGRVGRSLGIHMLLATQRLEEGRLRGLDTYLSYRISLKTFSAAESRAAIGVPDAFALPPVPGSGYLSVQGEPLTGFKAAYVSGPQGSDDRSLMDVVVDRLVDQGPPAHEVWLPPLDRSPPLDFLLGPLTVTEDRGLSPQEALFHGGLRAPLGIVDKPFEQRRDLLVADFAGGGGNGVVVGGPQSGKSTLLRTLITSMALTHTPEEVQFYCVDLGGGGLSALASLPHVGGVASRLDADVVRRTVAELSALVLARERLFRARAIDSVAEFRKLKRRGEVDGDDFGDVFLVVDGWMNFRTEFDELEREVTSLAGQGLAYGVHVVLATNRWAEIRPALKDVLGTQFELRLGDPNESSVHRRAAAGVPADRPGRGLLAPESHFLTALPRVDSSNDAADLSAGLVDLTTKVSVSWSGPKAPKVRVLPDVLPYDDLLAQFGDATVNHWHLVPIGVDEEALAPVVLDFGVDSHFLYLADSESGKTTFLRTVVRGIMNAYDSSEALIMLVDYRRTMLGFVETDHMLSYIVSSAQLTHVVQDVVTSMKGRLPGPDVTQEQLKNRSWWNGPDLFVVVDDYDMVAPQGGVNPLTPLAEFIPLAKDIGLHLIVARRTGGVSRAMFDPVLGKLKEISTSTFIGNGSKDEGVVIGAVRPSEQPPGRGTLINRREGKRHVQTALLPAE